MELDALPKVPTLTKEQRAEEEEIQLTRARKFTEQVSPTNVYFRRAAAIVKETDAIFGEYVSLPKRKSLLTPIQIQRYADALARLGRYLEADKYDSGKDYKAVWAAIVKDDNLTCKCKPIKQMQQSGEVVIYPTTFVKRYVFSTKHNRVVPLMQCNECAFTQAK